MTDREIIEALLGEPGTPARARVREAAEQDRGFRDRVALIERMLEALAGLAGDPHEEEPISDAQRRRLHRLIRIAHPEPPSRVASLAQSVIALLAFDSARAPAAAGVRGGAQARLLRYEGEGFELELMLTPAFPEGAAGGPAVSVAGEIRAGDKVVHARARGLDDDQDTEIMPDADGLFSITLPRGTYAFDVHGEGRRYITPPLSIASD